MEWKINRYASLDSTNEEAFRAIATGKVAEGWVLWANEQTQGRGAGENHWESEPGKNLTFSLVLQPGFMLPEQQFVLTQCISLALYNVAEKRLGRDNLFIKWPNDIWFEQKKIAGVLIQNLISGNHIRYAVVGVGLNVNQTVFFSDAPNPASLIHFTGKTEDIELLLTEILHKFDSLYVTLSKDINALNQSYLEKLYRYGQQGTYRDADGVFEARLTGVDHYGRLLLRDDLGKQRIYGFKEVEFL